MNIDEWVVDSRLLPDKAYADDWDSIIADNDIKDRLVNQALLAIRLRERLPFTTTALHGLLLLFGPPGTGKTTLARGLAQTLCVPAGGRVRFIEVNPHGLMSAEHGQSQQHVIELLCDYIPTLIEPGMPTVVLLDEVESMAVARSAASLSANPADVHRATDAVLTALDRNAREHPQLITVATSNFDEALDEAFRSRADLAIEIPLPDAAGAQAILASTLQAFGAEFPGIGALAKSPKLTGVAASLVGLDGRRIRKVVTEALATDRAMVRDPNKLTIDALTTASRRLKSAERKELRRAAA